MLHPPGGGGKGQYKSEQPLLCDCALEHMYEKAPVRGGHVQRKTFSMTVPACATVA